AGGVARSGPRACSRAEPAVRVTRDRADPAEGPTAGDLHVVPALLQAGDRLLADAVLDRDVPGQRLAPVERARGRPGVVLRRLDRLLQVEPEVDVAEKRVQRPLVLLVAAGCAEGEIRLAAARGHRRRQRRPRPLPRLQRARQALLEPEHLGPGAEAEP